MTDANRLSESIHALLACGTAPRLIERAGEYLKNPVILSDLSLHILAVTPDDAITDPRWISLCREQFLPANLVNISLYRRSLHTAAPVVSTDTTGLLIARCAVAQEGKLIGYLLSPCYYGPPERAELDLLRVLADLCSVRMQKDMHYAQYPEDMSEYFISDLLNGAVMDEQKIRDRFCRLGWRVRLPYRILTLRSADPSEMADGAGYLAQTGRCGKLARRFPEAMVFLYGEQIKLITGGDGGAVRERIVLQEISELLGQNGLVAGVSQPGYRFRDMAARHRQAMKALQMGLLLNGGGPLYYYDSYSVYHALELCADIIELKELCHAAVLTLEQYDRKNGTALMGTLHAYLANGKNASEAAAALYIHRNTLAKRLEKINDLITVDLNNRETVFHLLFSFRVIEYYGATQLRDSYDAWVARMPTLRHL